MQAPSHFEYEKATSVDHALACSLGGGARRASWPAATLIPMMKLRLARPEALIDINDLTELDYIRLAASRRASCHRRADPAPAALGAAVAEHYPIFRDAERVIADPIVRNRGTIGGSLCQADPSEDLSAAFAAVDAVAVIRGAGGSRTVPVREFHTGPYETVVGPAELLIEIRVRDPPRRRQRVREGGAAGSATGRSPRPGRASGSTARPITDVGIGLTAVGAEHFHAGEAEDFLRGQPGRPRRNFAPAGSSPASTASPAPTSADRSTTSATWPASSPRGRCAAALPGPGTGGLTCRSP